MKTSKRGKSLQPTGPRSMIIETHYCNRKEVLAMTYDLFTIDGVEFRITGVDICETTGEATCTVKNLANGKTSEIEHQKLCRLIKQEQQKETLPAEDSAPKKLETTEQQANLF